MRRLAALLLTSTTLLPSAFLLLPFPSPLLAQQPPATAPSPELAEAERLNQQVIQLYQQGKYAEAIPLAERTLAIREKVLGANHPTTASSLNNLAELYKSQGRYSEAEPLFKRALAIRERQLGVDHPATAESLNNLAVLYESQGRYSEAEPLYKRALAIDERQLGADHPDIATDLNNLAGLYKSQGRYGEAEPLYQRALAIRERQLGAAHPATATSLNNLAVLYDSQGRYGQAEPLYQRALAIRERQLGADHPTTATSLNNLAGLYQSQGRYGEAEPLYKRALAIRERQLGADHPATAISLSNLALLYRSQGRYSEAEPLYKRALAINERQLGANHPTTAISLSSLALLYDDQGRYGEAEPLLKRALAIHERQLGADHPDTATTLNNLALSYYSQGRYGEAEPLYQRALAIRERQLGADHPDIALSLNNLAALYRSQGRYADAEPLYQRALRIHETQLGANHPTTALSLNNLAGLYHSQGRYAEAEPLLQRALHIYETQLGANHPDTARSLNSLAGLYESQRRYAEAEPLYQRALTIRETQLGANHPDTAISLNNLALLYRSQGRYGEAEPLFHRALKIYETQLGANHPDTAGSLNNLALLYESQGRYGEAETLFHRALKIHETQLGANHPSTTLSLNNLAHLYYFQGRYDRAIPLLSQGVQVEEHNLAVNLAVGAEQQKRDYIRTISGTTYYAISLNLQGAPTNPHAGRLALTVILQRKGRILDVLGQSLQAIRQSANPQDKKLLDDLTAVRSQLSVLVYRGIGNTPPEVYRQQIKDLEAKSNQLEAQLNNRSASFRQQSQPVTLEAVQRLIPKDAALVEFVVYEPFNPTPPSPPLPRGGDSSPSSHGEVRGGSGSPPSQGGVRGGEKWGKPRYAAYVLRASGEPQWVDLGEAAAIDQAVDEFRIALQRDDWSVDRIQAPGRKLDALIMAPVRKLAGKTTTLLISPDGQLNLIPFAALVDEQNRYLVETTTLAYLSSGRDLLRFQEPIASQQPPVILVNPNYDQPGDAQVALIPSGAGILPAASTRGTGRMPIPPGSTLSADMVRLGFAALDTSPNAPSIVPNIPGAVVLAQRQATKQVVLGLRSPSLLHIHTHGFFLPDQPREQPASGLNASEPRPVHSQAENPLVRSGLALAGANLSKTGKADGILTAFEVTGLNLFGTKLVVLSACETGLGSVANGEGVYGLRRAFVLAGAESLLMSLWKVDDAVTRELMTDYYENLRQGMGRAEALRQVQLALMAAGRYQPYYWAAFVPSGNWAPMGL